MWRAPSASKPTWPALPALSGAEGSGAEGTTPRRPTESKAFRRLGHLLQGKPRLALQRIVLHYLGLDLLANLKDIFHVLRPLPLEL
jgi:hypothetical protein